MWDVKIFISYRRADGLAKGLVRSIRKSLEKEIRRAKVFVDENDVGASKDFPKKLADEVAASHFMLLLIGPSWEDILKDRAVGRSPDFVVYEMDAARVNNIHVVPILLDYTPEPNWNIPLLATSGVRKAGSLPLSANLNYDADIKRIADSLKRVHEERKLNKSIWDKIIGKSKKRLELSTQQSIIPRPLNILVVLGENVAYERALVDGMKDRLEAALGSSSAVRLHPIAPDFKDNDGAAKEKWEALIHHGKLAFDGAMVHYIVSVGTFASKAVRDGHLVAALEARGQIYMGVTSPENAGLLNQRDIAGVQYGTGGRDYAELFHELFPLEQRLVFIYNDLDGYEQDRSFAAELSVLNGRLAASLGGRNRFELRALGHLMRFEDLELADPRKPTASPVYMAWYDLDNLVSLMHKRNDPNLAKQGLWIVPSTYTLPNMNFFGAVVGVDDESGGQTAADIILQHAADPTLPLEGIPMLKHGFRAVMKQKILLKKGIHIRPGLADKQSIDARFRFETRESGY